MRILLIEDEVGLARGVRRGLEQALYLVDVVHDGREGLERALEETYSLIILDLMLPGMDGIQVCEELRARRRAVPILMLTARGTVPERVRGLEAGADDYLPKPFDFSELLARVQALLRRDKVNKGRVIRVADLEIDTRARSVTRAGKEITLTQREYLLLEALASHEGRVLTRAAIQERIWIDEDSFSNVVDVFIGQLRKKVDADHDLKLIQTVRGAGYVLRGDSPDDR